MRSSALARVGLLEAAEDPRLLGASLTLWPWQRALLAAIEAGSRLHVIAAGRRASKTTVAALVAVWCCLLRPDLLERLRPGERGFAVCIATNQRQGRLFVDAARSLVERSPLLASLIASTTDDAIEFTNGTTLAAFPCGSRGARGWPIFCLVLDEFAHHLDGDGHAAGAAVWRSTMPATAQFADAARVLVSSTPAGSTGLFADLWRRAEAGELAGARAYHATSSEANPTLSPEFLEAERLTLGEDIFGAEYLASFAAGGGSFFDAAEVRQVVGSRGEAMPDEARGWVAALDPSSGAGDPFAIAVVGRDARPGYQGRLLVGHVQRWMPQPGNRASRRSRAEVALWVDSVLDGVAEIVRRFNAMVLSDQHIPGVVRDELRKRGVGSVIPRPWTTLSRTSAFQAVRARIVTERIELVDDKQLVSELLRVRTRFRGGAATIEVPRVGDSHGDLAVALAAAVFELDASGVTRSRATFGRPRGSLDLQPGAGDATWLNDRLGIVPRGGWRP